MSQRGLSEILQLLPSGEDNVGTSRSSLKRKRVKGLSQQTPVGPLFRQMASFDVEKGQALKVTYVHPGAMLWTAVERCPQFRAFLHERAAEVAPSVACPWDIVLYCDEVSPGNQLQQSNDRKLQVVYWSLKQLGGVALAKEESWFLLLAARSLDVNRLRSGMSQLMRRALHVFVGEEGRCLRDGLPVPGIEGPPLMICARVGDNASFCTFWFCYVRKLFYKPVYTLISPRLSLDLSMKECSSPMKRPSSKRGSPWVLLDYVSASFAGT